MKVTLTFNLDDPGIGILDKERHRLAMKAGHMYNALCDMQRHLSDGNEISADKFREFLEKNDVEKFLKNWL